MTTTRVFSDPRPQFRKDDDTVNTNGKLYFREPVANSTTLKSVYSNKELTTALTNPVLLDAMGRAPTIYLDGDYSVEETTSSDVQIWRIDNYEPVALEGQYNEWSSSLTYVVEDIVRYTDGKYYIALQSANLAKTPPSSPTYWSEMFLLTVYNSSKTYASGDVVYYDGNLYTSLQASNTGNTPDTSYTYWKLPGSSVPAITNYTGSTLSYVYSGLASSLRAVIGNITESTWQSVGPTGSGADDIWSVMDSIPSNATSITLHVKIDVERTSGASDDFIASINYRKDSGAASFPIAAIGIGSATEPAAASNTCQVDIPLTALKTFDVNWTTTNDTGLTSINLYFAGFKVA